MARYKIWVGGMSHPRGLGFIIIPLKPVEQAVEQPTEPEVSMLPPNLVEELRRDLWYHTRRIDLVAMQIQQGFERMDRQQYCPAQRQAEVYSYYINYNTALVNMFARMNPAAAPLQFPPPPTLSVYPPANLDPDADNEEDKEDDDDVE